MAHVAVLGARTPVGLRPESAAVAIVAGVGLVQEHPSYIDTRGEPLMAAYDTKLDQDLTVPERLQVLAHDALRQLGARIPQQATLDVPLLLATPEWHPGFGEHDEQRLERALTRSYGPLRIRSAHTISRGHAGALEAMHEAARLVASTAHSACVVGGVDSWLDPHTLAWLSSLRRLACDGARSAFIPGEGACFALVVSHDLLRALGMPSLARIRGSAVASEPCSLLSGLDNLGHGLTAVVRGACVGLEDGELVGDIYCDLNGETYRAQEWGLVLMRTQSQLRDGTAYIAPADRWGDLGAATGTALMMVPIVAWQRGHARRGPLALIFAGSDGGRRAALLLEQPSR